MVASHPVEKSKLVQVLVAPYRVVSIDARCRAVVLLTEQSARITLLVRQPTQPTLVKGLVAVTSLTVM